MVTSNENSPHSGKQPVMGEIISGGGLSSAKSPRKTASDTLTQLKAGTLSKVINYSEGPNFRAEVAILIQYFQLIISILHRSFQTKLSLCDQRN